MRRSMLWLVMVSLLATPSAGWSMDLVVGGYGSFRSARLEGAPCDYQGSGDLVVGHGGWSGRGEAQYERQDGRMYRDLEGGAAYRGEMVGVGVEYVDSEESGQYRLSGHVERRWWRWFGMGGQYTCRERWTGKGVLMVRGSADAGGALVGVKWKASASAASGQGVRLADVIVSGSLPLGGGFALTSFGKLRWVTGARAWWQWKAGVTWTM